MITLVFDIFCPQLKIGRSCNSLTRDWPFWSDLVVTIGTLSKLTRWLRGDGHIQIAIQFKSD